ncbi:V-type ATP synthase subunit I [Spirochaeta africana]|nr:V-type ATPase 116kDa subunit family protein [Spirochaeta africana]
MKKAHIIVQSSQRTAAARILADAGLLHVKQQQVENQDISGLVKLRHTVERASNSLPAEAAAEPASADPTQGFPGLEQAVELADTVLDRAETVRQLQEQRDKLQREVDRLLPWGDFDPQDIAELAGRGLSLELRIVSAREWEQKPAELPAWITARDRTTLYIAVLRGDELPTWDAGREIALPQAGLQALKEQISDLSQQIQQSEDSLRELTAQAPILREAERLLTEYIEFEQVVAGMQDADELSVLTGYIPAEEAEHLKAVASQSSWGILMRDPDAQDTPPTKLRNPRWVRIIQPVFNLLGTVPGYRELDISAMFLIFFAVFFGMIISDAGYGSLLLAAALFFSVRAKRSQGSVPDGLVLMMVLSLATVVWGGITGNWFGYEPIARTAPFSYIIVPQLHSFETHSLEFVQRFCFVLAVIHLSLAFLWNFRRALAGPHKLKAFAEIGWLVMIIGLFFLVRNVVLGDPFPQFALYLIIGGFGAVTVFGAQEGNFLKGIGKGLAEGMTNALSSVSRFSDIVSYIRLFAVGLASIEIAKSFNAMGLSVVEAAGGGAAAIVAGALIMLVGHSINLMMAALSVVVHGVRLNMLEFSGALGMEWTGELFRPFRARAPKAAADAGAA